MPTCPSCRRDQLQTSAFCAYCGALLDRPASSDSAPVDQASADSATTVAPPVGAAPLAPIHEFGDVGAYIVRRVLALLVDLVLVGTLIAIAARAWIASPSTADQLSARAIIELATVVGAALFAYRWLFEGVAGTTLGKLLFGLGVGRAGGGSAGLLRAFVRTLLLPVDLLVVGFLLAALTPRRRRLGDLIAGTVVANSRIGALAPLVGVIALGAAAFADYTYAGGITTAAHLARDARQFAPSLSGNPSPSSSEKPSS